MRKKIIIMICIIGLNCIFINKYLIATDELWVYANIYKMTIGYKIYEDLNVIQTPIFFILGNLFLQLLGRNFFVFEIYGMLINSCFIGMIYMLLRSCNITKKNAIIYIIIIWGMLIDVLSNGANYNILVYIFVLLGIVLEIKYKFLKSNKWWIQTILSMIIFLTKQNIGIYYFIGICILELIWNRKLVKILKQGLLSVLMFIGLLVLLRQIGVLEGFLNYTVWGLKEFNNKNLAVNSLLLGINIILPALSTISYLYLKFKQHIEDDRLDILYIMGMLMLLFAYPLFNTVHILLSIIVIFIYYIYIIEKIIFEGYINDSKYDKFVKIVIMILVIPTILYSVLSVYSWFTNMEKDNWNNPYFGAIFDEETKSEIEVMTKYIKEKEAEGIKVYVFSNKASLYNIPLGICNGAMDLPMTGNFGKDGEEGMIETIKSLENGEILIDKEYENDYQKPLKVREWIENNLEKQGEIEEFIIYNLGNE